MDIEKLIERLNQYSQPMIAYKLGADFADACTDAATALSAQQAENAQLRVELMTREEAIAVLAESKRQNEVMRDNPSTFWESHKMADGVKNAERRIAALDMAIDALDPPNEPLTFAELREMEGEPVWVEHNNGGGWLVIHWDYVGRITTAHKACLLDYEYGRTWLAYRHPLEGEANG